MEINPIYKNIVNFTEIGGKNENILRLGTLFYTYLYYEMPLKFQ